MGTLNTFLICLVGISVGSSSLTDAQEPPVDTLLGTVPEPLVQAPVWFSRLGNDFITAPRDGEAVVILTRKGKGPRFDEVRSEGFSPDGKTLIYQARADRKWFAVYGDTLYGPHDDVTIQSFDREKRPLYLACDGGQWFVMEGRERGEGFDEIRGFPAIGGLLAYVAKRGKTKVLVWGNQKIEGYDDVQDPVFTDGLDTLAFAAEKAGKWFVMVGAHKGPDFDWVADGPVPSPDGKSVAYRAYSGHRSFLVVNDLKVSEDYDYIGTPVFSPDGKSIAFSAKLGEKEFMIVDARKGEEYDDVGKPVFSPDGKRLAYTAWRGHKQCLVVDGKESSDWFDEVGRIAFSKDGKAVAFAARRARKKFVVVGDRRSEEYDVIRALSFSGEGDRVSFGATKGREIHWLTLRASP
jgi:WD40 repeat protein